MSLSMMEGNSSTSQNPSVRCVDGGCAKLMLDGMPQKVPGYGSSLNMVQRKSEAGPRILQSQILVSFILLGSNILNDYFLALTY
jgi:hypothetical protein